MKSFRTLLAAAAVAAMAMVSTAAHAVSNAAVESVKTLGEAAHTMVTNFMWATGLIMGITINKADAYTGKYPLNPQPRSSSVYEIPVPFTLPATNPTANDILALFTVPLGVQVIDWTIQTEDCDAGTAFDFTLGSLKSDLSDIDTAWKTAITVGQTGALLRCADSVAFSQATTAARPIGLKFTTAATTYTGSKKGLLVLRCVG